MKYRVLVREVWVHAVYVEADSKEEAIEMAADIGNRETGEEEHNLEYSHTLSKETWTVDEEE